MQGASKRSRRGRLEVDPTVGAIDVGPQVFLPEKRLAALTTREAPVVGVRPLVPPHLGVCPEGHFAVATFEWSFARVCP